MDGSEMKQLDLVGLHLDVDTNTPMVVVREHESPHRVLPIVIGGSEAASIAVALGDRRPPRPLSHDLMAAILSSVGARVRAVEVTALRGGAFIACLALAGPGGERRLDARPSDAIALAVRSGAPLFASEEVLAEAGTLLPEELEEQVVDRAVDEFRAQLDRLDPAALAVALGEPTGERGESPPPPDDPPADPTDDDRD